MDATDLFGGESPSSAPVAGSGPSSANEPLSAASLFGGMPENGRPARAGSVKHREPQVQDMPDDLFGSGGDMQGSPFGISADDRAFPQAHHPPLPSTLPQVRSVPAMEHVPDGLFGSGSNDGPSSLGFGEASSTWSKPRADPYPEPALAAFGGGRAPSSSHDFWEAPPSTSNPNGLGSEPPQDGAPSSGWSVGAPGAHPEDLFAQSAPVPFYEGFQGAAPHSSNGQSLGFQPGSSLDATNVFTRDDEQDVDTSIAVEQLPAPTNRNPASPPPSQSFGAPPTTVLGPPPLSSSGKEDARSRHSFGVSSPPSSNGCFRPGDAFRPSHGAVVLGDGAPPISGSRRSSLQSVPSRNSISPPIDAFGGTPPQPAQPAYPSGEAKQMGDSQWTDDASRMPTLSASWQDGNGFAGTRGDTEPRSGSVSGPVRSEGPPPLLPPPPPASGPNAYPRGDAFSAPMSSSSVGMVMDSGESSHGGNRWDGSSGYGSGSVFPVEGQCAEGTAPFGQQGTLRSPAEEMFGASPGEEDESSVPWWQTSAEEGMAEEEVQMEGRAGSVEEASPGLELPQEGAAGPSQTQSEELRQSTPSSAPVGGIEAQATDVSTSQAFGVAPASIIKDDVGEPAEDAAANGVVGVPAVSDVEDDKALELDEKGEPRELSAPEGENGLVPGAVDGGLFTVAEDSTGYDDFPRGPLSPGQPPTGSRADVIHSGMDIVGPSSFAPPLFSRRSESWRASQPPTSMSSSGSPNSAQNGRLFASESFTTTSRERSLSPPPSSPARSQGAQGLIQTRSSFYGLKDQPKESYSNIFRAPPAAGAIQGANPKDQAAVAEPSDGAATGNPLGEDPKQWVETSAGAAIVVEDPVVSLTYESSLTVSLSNAGEEQDSAVPMTSKLIAPESERRGVAHAEAPEPKEDAGCDDVKDGKHLVPTEQGDGRSCNAHQEAVAGEIKTPAQQADGRHEAMIPKGESSEDVKADGLLTETALPPPASGLGTSEEKGPRSTIGYSDDDRLNGGVRKDDDDCDAVARVASEAVHESALSGGGDPPKVNHGANLLPNERTPGGDPCGHSGGAEAKCEVSRHDDVKDGELRQQEDHGHGLDGVGGGDDGDGDDNELSVAETTASDFFAPPGGGNPDDNANPGSPRPISRCNSRASVSSMISSLSVGQVSVDSLGGRRVGNAGSGPVGRVRASPFAVPDGPPIFPLGNYTRPRRPSFEGLPPPVPPAVPPLPSSADSDRPSRNSWRSLSPSRITRGDRDRWSMSPSLRYGTKGSPSDSVGTGNMSSGTRVGVGTLGLPNRMNSSAMTAPFQSRSPSAPILHDPVRAPERDRRPMGDSGSRFMGSPQGPVMVIRERNNDFKLSSRPGAGENHGEASRPTAYDGLSQPSFLSSTPVTEAAAPMQARFENASPPLPSEATAEESLDYRPEGKIAGGSASTGMEGIGSNKGTATDARKDPIRGISGESDQTAVPSSAIEATCEGDNYDGMAREGSRPDESGRKDTSLDGEALVTSFVNDGSAETPKESWSHVPRPHLSEDLFGSSAGDFGLSARPSPLVNTSSPLTAPPEGSRPSLFSKDDDYVAVGAEGTTSGAATIFAAEPPASTADTLFGGHASPQDGVVAEQWTGGNGGEVGNTPADDPFSQGPPRETPMPQPVSSLPNPWGSSPLKQPLPARQAWPTEGGTGFDRQGATTATQAAGSAPLRSSSADGRVAGALPAASMDPESYGSGNGDVMRRTQSLQGGDKALGLEVHRRQPRYGSPPGPAASLRPHGSSGGTIPYRASRPWERKRGDEQSASSVAARNHLPQGFRPAGPFGQTSSVSSVPTARESTGAPFQAKVNSGTGGWAGRGTSPGMARDPTRKPAGVIARFGFGGRLVCMHPRRKMKLASSSGAQPSLNVSGLSNLRAGPVKIWALKDLAPADAIVSDVDNFPGPASSANPKNLKEYVEKRASGGAPGLPQEAGDGGIRLLWTVAALSLRFKGQLTGEAGAKDPSSPEAALVSFLKELHARARDRTGAKAFESAAPAGAGNSPGNPAWGSGGTTALAFPGSVPHGMASMAPGVGTKGKSLGSFPMARPAGVPGGPRMGVPAPFASSPEVGSVGGAGAAVEGAALGQENRLVEIPERVTGSREEVEALLVDGKKEEAVEASIRAGLWGLALLISAQCTSSPGSEAPYQRTVRLYANAFLESGTPLYTMALAFSGQAGDTIKHGGKSLCGVADGGRDGVAGGRAGRASGGGFEENWPMTAAAIISNKVSGWTEQLIALGDRLVESNNVPAAHALFLVAGLQIELPNAKDGRIALPGVDVRKPGHRTLRTREATEAVHVLEVLEVAGRESRGPNSAVQGHKLRLAMRLADIGHLEKAVRYAQSAQEEVAIMKGRARSGAEPQSPYSPQFLKALDDFEERVCAAQGLPVLGVKMSVGGRGDKGESGSSAGGWLFNRVTQLVISSATPGPAPAPRPSQHASPVSGDGQRAQALSPSDHPKSGTGPHGGALAPPQPVLPTPFPAPVSSGRERGGRPALGSTQPTLPTPFPAPPVSGGRDRGARPAPGSSQPALPTPFPAPPVSGRRERGARPAQGSFSASMRGAPPFSGTPPAARPSEVPSPGWGTPGPGMGNPGSGAGVHDAFQDRNMNPGDRGKTPLGTSNPAPSPPSASDVTEPSPAKSPNGSESRLGGVRQSEGSPVGVKKETGKDNAKDKPSTDKREKKKRESAKAAVGTQPGRLAKMVTKWLYPDAKHADVGNKMEAYYDTKEKRWVFPDETPEDKTAARPSAPPTAAQLSQSASPTGPRAASPAPASTPGIDANDPLAALMAPPKSSVPSSRSPGPAPTSGMGANDPLAALMAPPKSSVQSARRHTSSGVHAAGGGPPSGGMNWGNMAAPPRSGGLSARSPFPPPGQNFTVFAPKAPAGSTSSNAFGGAGPSVGSAEDSQQPAAG